MQIARRWLKVVMGCERWWCVIGDCKCRLLDWVASGGGVLLEIASADC